MPDKLAETSNSDGLNNSKRRQDDSSVPEKRLKIEKITPPYLTPHKKPEITKQKEDEKCSCNCEKKETSNKVNFLDNKEKEENENEVGEVEKGNENYTSDPVIEDYDREKEAKDFDSVFLAIASGRDLASVTEQKIPREILLTKGKVDVLNRETDSFIIPLHRANLEPQTCIVSGAKGSGKSFFAKNMIMATRKILEEQYNKKLQVIFCSEKKDMTSLSQNFTSLESRQGPEFCLLGDPKTEDWIKPSVKELTDLVKPNTIDVLENTLIIFDDTNNHTSDYQKEVQQLQDAILTMGRSKRIYFILVSHFIGGRETAKQRNEADVMVFFHTTGNWLPMVNNYIENNLFITKEKERKELRNAIAVDSVGTKSSGWFAIINNTFLVTEKSVQLLDYAKASNDEKEEIIKNGLAGYDMSENSKSEPPDNCDEQEGEKTEPKEEKEKAEPEQETEEKSEKLFTCNLPGRCFKSRNERYTSKSATALKSHQQRHKAKTAIDKKEKKTQELPTSQPETNTGASTDN